MCAGTFEAVLALPFRDAARAAEAQRPETEFVNRLQAGCQEAFREIVDN